MTDPCRLILDVDTGIDDAMAILYALGRPGIRLEALTTTFGNTDVDTATANTLAHSRTRRARSEIPVARGSGPVAAAPFVKGAEHVHGANGLGGVALPAPAGRAGRRTRVRPHHPHGAGKSAARSRCVRSARSPMSRSRSPRRPKSRPC